MEISLGSFSFHSLLAIYLYKAEVTINPTKKTFFFILSGAQDPFIQQPPTRTSHGRRAGASPTTNKMKRVRTLNIWYKSDVATENSSVNNDQAAELGKMQVPEPEQNQSAPSQIEQATAFERDQVNANKFENSCRRNKNKTKL